MYLKRLEKIFRKGFLNAILYGREGYFISPDGELRLLSDDEVETILNESKIQEAASGCRDAE